MIVSVRVYYILTLCHQILWFVHYSHIFGHVFKALMTQDEAHLYVENMETRARNFILIQPFLFTSRMRHIASHFSSFSIVDIIYYKTNSEYIPGT